MPEPADKAVERPVGSDKGSPAAGTPRHKAIERPEQSKPQNPQRDRGE